MPATPNPQPRTARLRTSDCDLDELRPPSSRSAPTLADFPLATEVEDNVPGLRRRPACASGPAAAG